jgi:tetratricopeptide (TPR) repeat protein
LSSTPRRGQGAGTRARAEAATVKPAAKTSGASKTGSSAKAGGSPKAGGAARSQSSAKAVPKPPSDADLARLAALSEERDFLLGSLRDLEAEHEAGDVDDRDYAALKDDYTARAAAVIRAIERPAAPSRRSQRSERPPRSMTSRVVVGALVALFAVGAGVVVAQWSGQRGAGDSITGGIRGDTRDDLLEARQQAADGQYLDAIKSYDKVIQLDPANTEALAYRGWMLRIVAQSASGQQQSQLRAEALASLQQALRTSPTDGTSLVFMAVLLGDLGKPQAALDELAKVPAGQLPSFMSSTIGQFRTQMETQLRAAPIPSTTTSTTTSTTASG